MSTDKTLKELLVELIDSLDYFRMLQNNEAILQTLQSIDNKLTTLIDLFSKREKKGYMEAEIKTLKGDKNET